MSWPVLLIPVIIGIPTAVFNARGWDMSFQTSTLGQLTGVGLMLGLLVLARFTWLRPDQESDRRSGLVVVTFAAASGVRLVGMGLVFAARGVMDQWPITVSAISGGIGLPIVLCLGAIAVNTVRSHARTMTRLETSRTQMERIRALTLEQVSRMQQDVVDEVLASARALLQRAGSDAAQVADVVRRAATEVVRPASHQLHSGELLADRLQAPDRPVRLRAVLADVRPRAPFFGPLIYELLVLGAVWGSQGPTVAGLNLVVGTTTLIGCNLVLARLWPATGPRRWPLAWLLFGYALANMTALVAVIAATALVGFNSTDLAVGLGLYPLAMGIGSVLFSALEQLDETERALSRAVDDEAIAMSQALRLAEDERRRLAHVMHGEVQAELTAASARLASAPKSDHDTVSQVMDSLMESLDAIDVSGTTHRRQNLEELWETWRLAIALDVDITPDAELVLGAEPTVESRVVSLVSEAITNAVRHGVDDGVMVDIDLDGALVRVEVRNRGMLERGSTGLGTTEIDRDADEWSVVQEGPEVVFTAIVAR